MGFSVFVCFRVMWGHSVCGFLLEGCVCGGCGMGGFKYTWARGSAFVCIGLLGVGGCAVSIWYGNGGGGGGGGGRRRMGVALCQRKSSNIVPLHNSANTVGIYVMGKYRSGMRILCEECKYYINPRAQCAFGILQL